MKILKPGKVDMRKFVCPKCECVFVAHGDETEFPTLKNAPYVFCPICNAPQPWHDGEPYEEPTQSDEERLTKLIEDWRVGPLKNWPPFLSDYLIANGVTFKEDI